MSSHQYRSSDDDNERFFQIQDEIIEKVRLRQPVNIGSYLPEIDHMVNQHPNINKIRTKENIQHHLDELGRVGKPKVPKRFDELKVPIIDI